MPVPQEGTGFARVESERRWWFTAWFVVATVAATIAWGAEAAFAWLWDEPLGYFIFWWPMRISLVVFTAFCVAFLIQHHRESGSAEIRWYHRTVLLACGAYALWGVLEFVCAAL